MQRFFCLLITLAVACPGAASGQASAGGATPRRHALLVACSTYPALPKQYHLLGPPNDAALFGRLINAIKDDEIRGKLLAIRKRGAFVFAIFDCCHSGTMLRGNEEETPRHVPPEELIPEDVLRSASLGEAEPSRGLPAVEVSPLTGSLDSVAPGDPAAPGGSVSGGLVAIYAALPTEKTFDSSFPKEGPANLQKRHGILTYAICQILERATSPLTYSELVARVRQQYVQWRRVGGPTPLVEGPDKDREILGERTWPGRSELTLVVAADGKLQTSAGALQGLTPGSVLAAYPPPGEGNPNQPLGYVRIAACDTLTASAEAHEYQGQKPPAQFPAGARLEVDYADLGLRKLRLALDADGPGGSRGDLLASLFAGDSPARLIGEVVSDPGQADWLVRVHDDRAYLVPAAGLPVEHSAGLPQRGLPVPNKSFGPITLDEHFPARLSDSLCSIARSQNLLLLAEPVDGARLGSGMARVEFSVQRLADRLDRQGQPVDLSGGRIAVQPGQLFGFKVTNSGRKPVDVTLLYVDSGFGITAWYPREFQFNRLAAGELIGPPGGVRPVKINDTTTGLEHIVLIAVANQAEPLNFAWLAQPTLAAAKVAPGLQRGALDTPLGQLFQSAAYGASDLRGVPAADVRDTCIRTISWKVEPARMTK